MSQTNAPADWLTALAEPLRHEGPRRFAHWDANLFEHLIAGPARELQRKLDAQPNAAQVLNGYLQLVQQAVGNGLLRQAAVGSAGWTNFLERCLVQLVPALLADTPPAERLPLLVQVWNLGEGLSREPEWVDRYVNACAGGLKRLVDLEKFLIGTLKPVLTPATAAAWTGPFAVTVLDLRPLHEEFLPGKLCLAAPVVLCVQDRRRPGLQAGVLLRRERQSQLLGLTQGLGDYVEAGERPVVAFTEHRLEIAGKTVELPFLRRAQHHAVAGAGFVAISAVDSQRLWIVESL